MRTIPAFPSVVQGLLRPALGCFAFHLLAAVLAAQCTNPTQVPNQTISSGTTSYTDNNALKATQVTVNGSASVAFVAGSCIELGPGFRATAGTAPTTFHAWVETAPSVISVSPASGSGLSRPFIWTVSSPSGYSNVADLYALFNTSLTGANACYIRYNRASNLLSVADNSGANWSPGIAPDSSGTTGDFNPNCTVNGTGSSFKGTGTQLEVTASVTFQSTFAGTKNQYMVAYDNEGLNTVWQQYGTWTVPGPPRISRSRCPP